MLTLTPLEAMKLTKHLIMYHDEFGEVVSGMINFITNEISRDAMLAHRDGTENEYCKKYGIEKPKPPPIVYRREDGSNS